MRPSVRKLREAGRGAARQAAAHRGRVRRSPSRRSSRRSIPWHADHWSGASSSGSGVATAAGLCFGSLGSDTGGSIRFPSAANGNTGLKPTWGRVSRHGCFELAASLDHIGPMCRSATDAAIMLGAIAGLDPHDPTTLRATGARLPGGRRRSLRGVRIGFDEALRARRRRARRAPRRRGDAAHRARARRRDRARCAFRASSACSPTGDRTARSRPRSRTRRRCRRSAPSTARASPASSMRAAHCRRSIPAHPAAPARLHRPGERRARAGRRDADSGAADRRAHRRAHDDARPGAGRAGRADPLHRAVRHVGPSDADGAGRRSPRRACRSRVQFVGRHLGEAGDLPRRPRVPARDRLASTASAV